MSDERLRELQRRYAETGEAKDGAAWHAERLRVGELTRERLEIAAHCGDAGAVHLLGADAPLEFARAKGSELEAWVEELLRWEGAPLRLLIEAGRARLPAWAAAFPKDDRLAELLDVASAKLRGEDVEVSPAHVISRRCVRKGERRVRRCEERSEAETEYDPERKRFRLMTRATRAAQAVERALDYASWLGHPAAEEEFDPLGPLVSVARWDEGKVFAATHCPALIAWALE